MATRISLFLFLLLINLVSSELVPEDGYTVSTIFDGNKLRINPRSVLPRPGTVELFILDSVNSVFYTTPFPVSHDAQIKPLSGDGVAGYSDGNSASSRFNRPRSFAVDLRGNVYVADKNNHAIRKISESGVTTIAGGYSQQTGKADGRALNASFSNDFEVSFVPQGCALLICDHGNQLIRQIILKPEDCGSGSKPVLGTSLVAVGVGVGVLSLLIGFAVRPYVTSCGDPGHHFFSKTWNNCLISLGKQVVTVFFDIKSAIAKSVLYALLSRLIFLGLSHLSLILRIHKSHNQNLPVEPVSLLDSDVNKLEVSKSQMFAEQLKDLIAFDDGQATSDTMNISYNHEDGDHERSNILTCGHGRLDGMIQANLLDFIDQAKPHIPLGASVVCDSGLVKRK